MRGDLGDLRIDRFARHPDNSRHSPLGWAMAALATGVLTGCGYVLYAKLIPSQEVQVVRLRAAESSTGVQDNIVLSATGYVIAAHKIDVASKVMGRAAWVGVEKGDAIRQGQVLVRLEDDEYRAKVLEAQGQLETARARLREVEGGSRPEDIGKAAADLDQARAELNNARATLERARVLVREGVLARQVLDDVQTKHDVQVARAIAFENAYELVCLGPRQEQIEALRAQVRQAQGILAFAQTQLENTVISAPVAGTVLERNVERGEFVTTGFVGDRGAKGYVASVADLKDLDVELDISQSDFANLVARQRVIITADAYPDRKYEGYIHEISPEANRQKATVQVKVKIAHPDEYLRPDMNASVAFVMPDKLSSEPQSKHGIVVPASAVRDDAVFIVVDGRVVRRAVKVAGKSNRSVQITTGLIGGEDLVVNAPKNLKDGDKVRVKEVL